MYEMLMSLIMFNIYIVITPNMMPNSLFFIFVGYERIIELNISISYNPVHSSMILSAMLLVKYIVS